MRRYLLWLRADEPRETPQVECRSGEHTGVEIVSRAFPTHTAHVLAEWRSDFEDANLASEPVKARRKRKDRKVLPLRRTA